MEVEARWSRTLLSVSGLSSFYKRDEEGSMGVENDSTLFALWALAHYW